MAVSIRRFRFRRSDEALYTKEWMDAQLAVKKKMEAFGLETAFDDVGNVFGAERHRIA